MVFSELSFLFFFLPTVVILYFALPGRVCKNGVLLLASLFFYAWGEPRHVLVMLCAALVAYVGGLLLHRCREKGKNRWKRAVFLLTVGLLVLNLLIFKYLGFLSANLAWLPFWPLPEMELALPIGISFYTFQILSYVIDLYWGKVKVQKHFLLLLLYLSFFPQLIAGPIVRYETVEKEILTRTSTWADIEWGTKRFLLGLGKKVLIANRVAPVAEIIYGGDPSLYGTVGYWLAALAYTLQIYFDFSGYSDMAIGLGRIFGFHFLENFNFPYVSCSVTEFWRRWHISLSSWFRDYVYIPLGGNRVSKGLWVRNILLVWLLTGFWHGAAWTFILWGLYYGLLLLAEKLFLGRILVHLPKALQWLWTFFLVNIGWVLFYQTDLHALLTALKMMFVYQPTAWLQALALDPSLLFSLLFLPLGLLLSFPLFTGREKCPRQWVLQVGETGLYLAMFSLCLFFILGSGYDPFIYFRF